MRNMRRKKCYLL